MSVIGRKKTLKQLCPPYVIFTGPIQSSSRDVHGYMCRYMSPSHVFFFAWTGAERPLSLDWCGASLAIAWSPKNGEDFGLNPFLITYREFNDHNRVSVL